VGGLLITEIPDREWGETSEKQECREKDADGGKWGELAKYHGRGGIPTLKIFSWVEPL